MTFPTASKLSLKWWTIETKNDLDIARAVVAYARHLELQETHKSREAAAEVYSRLYSGTSLTGLKPWQLSPIFNTTSKLSNNVIATCIDAATARIASQRPAPKFSLNGGSFALRRKTPKLNKFGKGMLHQSRSYELGPTIFRDGCIFGTGVSKIIGDRTSKLITNERVMPWDILVDDQDAYQGKPRTMTQRAYVDRYVLCEMYPKFKDEIMSIQPHENIQVGNVGPSDQVVVYESWHLPSGPEAEDGKHVIAIDNALLFQEEWQRNSFPFAFFKWKQPIGGFWGYGIAAALMSIQFEINTILAKIQMSMRLMGVTKVFLSNNSGTPKSHINNDIGTIITYNGGNPPTVVAPQSVHPELFNQVDRLIARAYAEVGLSELSAESRKPAGLDSGKALREYNDIESERFIIPGRAYEQWFMDVVSCALDEVKEIPGFSVDVPDKNEQIKINWKDIDLDRDAYIIQCFPQSILPQTPAGRTQTIEEWQRLGWVSDKQAQELLEIPDLEEASNLATAALRATRARVEAMLDTDEPYVAPEPYDDLQSALMYVNAVYLDEREKGCSEEKLELLRRYINDIMALLNPPQAQQPQMQPQNQNQELPPGQAVAQQEAKVDMNQN